MIGILHHAWDKLQMVKKTPPMNGYPNLNCVQRETCLSPRTKRQRTLAIQRAQQIMDVPLEYVPNQQFEAWSRNKKAENEVLGPMPVGNSGPAGGESAGKVPPPSGLAPYVASLYEVPLLTREQEVHLFRKLNYLKYKANGLRGRLDPLRPQRKLLARIENLCRETVATRNQIICANLRLVVSIAKQYLGPVQSFFELVSDGNVSLMRAVERFDYSLGNRFSTYATWAIVNNFARSIPESMRYRDHFRTDLLRLLTATSEASSNQHELEAAQSRREIALDGILRRLDDREREIIICRFGLRRGYKPQTLQQLGEVMGVSRERIRQIEARAAETAPSYGPGTAAGSTEKGIS